MGKKQEYWRVQKWRKNVDLYFIIKDCKNKQRIFWKVGKKLRL